MQPTAPDTVQTDTASTAYKTRAQRQAEIQNQQIPVIPRADFVKMFGERYSSGQHVTLLGPTQKGKTTLALQLLSVCISPERKATILAGKPDGRDGGMERAPQLLNMRRIKTWPPEYQYGDKKRNGYVLRPLGKASEDHDEEERVLTVQFRKALRGLYASKKPVLVVVDEASLVYEDLKLKKEYEASLKRGAPVVAQWSLIQRGRNISYHAYNAPEHIFIFYDPDSTNRERYSDFGGVDPVWIQYLTETLKTEELTSGPGKGMTVSQALYIRRAGPQLAIVDIH